MIIGNEYSNHGRKDRTYNGKKLTSSIALKLPVVSTLVQNVVTARLARTLGTLISSGVLLIQAMQITQKVLGNVVISERISGVIDEIKMGKGLTVPLKNLRYFPPMLNSHPTSKVPARARINFDHIGVSPTLVRLLPSGFLPEERYFRAHIWRKIDFQ